MAFSTFPIELPARPGPEDVHSWHLYVIRLDSAAPINRDEFISRMSKMGVGCSVHFIPLHMHPVWRELGGYSKSDFPVASEEYENAVSLPIFSAMTEGQVGKVIEAVGQVLGQ